MKSQSQILTYSVFSIIFVILLAWFANDLIRAAAPPVAERKWSDSKHDRADFEWFAQFWQVQSLSADLPVERFRFWVLPSFETSFLVEIEKKGDELSTVSLKTMKPRGAKGPGQTERDFRTGYLLAAEARELEQILLETRFWATPPGELDWSCVRMDDGESYVVETNFGQQYRLWSNSCEPSEEMLRLSRFFHGIASRLAFPSKV